MNETDTIAACPDCQGLGWYSSGPVLGGATHSGLVACHCRVRVNQRQQYTALLERSNLEPWREKTFTAFDKTISGVSRAYATAQRYSEQLTGWLVLTGPYGVGKTHLAAAIANVVLDRDMAVYFAVVGDLLDILRATFDRDESDITFDKLFRQVKDIPLLVLDDLGTEKETAWAQEKIFQILDWRYSRQLATILTSNRDKSSIDPRIISRASDLAFEQRLITIQANDYRTRNLHGGWLESPEAPALPVKRARTP